MYWAQIAGLNIDEFAKDMFTAGTDISNKTMVEIFQTDVKAFDIEEQKVHIVQSIIYDFDAIDSRKEEIEESLQTIHSKSDAVDTIVCFTSIHDNGSRFYAMGKHMAWIEEALGPMGSFREGILSRKIQIVPALSDIYQLRS